jgi:hypothetical protein
MSDLARILAAERTSHPWRARTWAVSLFSLVPQSACGALRLCCDHPCPTIAGWHLPLKLVTWPWEVAVGEIQDCGRKWPARRKRRRPRSCVYPLSSRKPNNNPNAVRTSAIKMLRSSVGLRGSVSESTMLPPNPSRVPVLQWKRDYQKKRRMAPKETTRPECNALKFVDGPQHPIGANVLTPSGPSVYFRVPTRQQIRAVPLTVRG